MIRRTLPVLATLSILFAATQASAVKSTPKFGTAPSLGTAAEFQRPDAKALVREAKELWHVKEDYTGALAKFNAAVDADPADNDTRLARAHFFETLSSIVVPESKAKFAARAQTDYEHIAAADPDSLIAGMARDGLTRLAGEPLIEAKAVACPEPATEAHAHANSLYGAQRFADAIVHYTKATAACPGVASWWVDFADTHYVMEDYARAKELFVRALSVDPWNREAHRYLADTEAQLAEGDAAVHQLILAVVSDPTYEAGWSALKSYALSMSRSWNRVYGDRKATPRSGDAESWAAYREAKAHARGASAGPASALELEREAVKSTLTSTSKGAGPFWSMMARAERAGFLDEAIFIHMLDASLAAEYPAFRETHAERLASYLETVILR